MSPRILTIAGAAVIVASAAAWWAIKPANDREMAPAPEPHTVTAAATAKDPGGVRCIDREGRLRAPLADGTCPVDGAGSRLSPQGPPSESGGTCETGAKTSRAGSDDPVLAAIGQGVCY